MVNEIREIFKEDPLEPNIRGLANFCCEHKAEQDGAGLESLDVMEIDLRDPQGAKGWDDKSVGRIGEQR